MLVAREAVILATGSTASMPPIPGLAEAGAWSNRQITTARDVPRAPGDPRRRRGRGRDGAGVAVVRVAGDDHRGCWTRCSRTRSRSSEQQVGQALGALGADLLFGAKAVAVRRDGGRITVELEDGRTVVGDRLLVAVGRRPNSAGLGLPSVGLADGGFVEVDDGLQVAGLPWLYAVGDVNGRALLTHMGKYQARIAADRIMGESDARAVADRHGSPRVVFTDPEVAAVGMTLAAAREAGIDALAVDLPTGSAAGASFVGRGSPGTSRFVVDRARQVLVGVTFVGPGVNDFLQAASIAVAAEVPLPRLAHAVAPFPTRSELWLVPRGVRAAGGRQRPRGRDARAPGVRTRS